MTVWIGGQRHAVAVPVIPSDAPPALREGLRRRRVAGTLGRCPCGARRPEKPVYDPDTGMDWYPVDHTPDCPSHDQNLASAIAAWQRQEGAPDGAHTR
jgi:hypothetical protein